MIVARDVAARRRPDRRSKAAGAPGMIPGIVSNCWQRQLEWGTALEDLLSQALDRGFYAVELRQTCLGSFEEPEGFVPKVSALGRLADRFRSIRLDLALAFPFLGPGGVGEDSLFQIGVDAARALSGCFHPHLRLVDLTTTGEMLQGNELRIAHQVVRLVEPMADAGGWLSLEHSRQPWTRFTRVLDEACRLLGNRSDHLRLCYDPANLLFASDRPDPSHVVRSLDVSNLSMVHLKQFRAGEHQTSIEDGEIDWEAQITGLARHGYSGPALFEVRPDEPIWRNLDRGRAYLESLGGRFTGAQSGGGVG